MDVWIGVLAFVLFLGFFTALCVCVGAVKRQSGIVIASRIRRKSANGEVIYANIALIILVGLVYFKLYTFVPAVLAFVAFIIMSTRIKSGLTQEGAIVGTTFLEWDDMKSYKLVDDKEDSNIVTLKIRANRKQYVLVCDRRDRGKIAELMKSNYVETTLTIHSKQMP